MDEKITIGKLSRMAGISRTALLYYDKIGVLTPACKTDAGYRLYDGAGMERLKKIMLLREAGMSLEQIKNIVSNQGNSLTALLMQKLKKINDEIARLRSSQEIVLGMLEKTAIADVFQNTDPADFKEILFRSGVISLAAESDEEQMKKWHDEFENLSPQNHRRLLELLGIQ